MSNWRVATQREDGVLVSGVSEETSRETSWDMSPDMSRDTFQHASHGSTHDSLRRKSRVLTGAVRGVVRPGVKALAALAAAAVVLLLGVSPVSAGTYPPPPDDIKIELPTNDNGDSYIKPGEPFELEFCCFEPGTYIEIMIDTSLAGAGIGAQELISSGPLLVGPDGKVKWLAPALPAGTYPLMLVVDGQVYKIMLSVGVVIPKTGSDSFDLLRPAAVLVAAGVVATLVSYRRRPSAPVASADSSGAEPPTPVGAG